MSPGSLYISLHWKRPLDSKGLSATQRRDSAPHCWELSSLSGSELLFWVFLGMGRFIRNASGHHIEVAQILWSALLSLFISRDAKISRHNVESHLSVWSPRTSLLVCSESSCLFNQGTGVMLLAFGCLHKSTQNNDFSFSMIIFCLWETFSTLLSKIGSSIMQRYEMRSFAAFSLELFVGIISYDKLPSFLTYLCI